MRTRLTALLVVLLGTVLVSLGVPLAMSVAAAEARSLQADRSADLTLIAGRLPSGAGVAADDVAAARRDLRRYHELFGAAVTVYDSAAHVRIRTAGRGPAGPPAEVRAALRSALAGRPSDAPARLMPWQRTALVVSQPVVREGDVVGAVVLESPVDGAIARVLRRWTVLAGAELIALVGASVLAVWLARWLLRPVARLDAAVHQIGAGDLGARVPVGSGPPELRRLERSFNEMAGAVESAVNKQRAFVADASHQLRNPLAALLLRLEGLRHVTVGRPEAVDLAVSEGEHLAGTLDRMLALARLESTGHGGAPVDIGALVDDRLRSWRVVADSRGILIDRAGVPRTVALHEPEALAGALDAVLDNALKYAPEGGHVAVDVRRTGGEVTVTVTDDGPGVPADDVAKVTDRFWRSPRTSHEPGSGLGMSIAKALLERYGGRLDVGPAGAHGLSVVLSAPAPPGG